MIKRGMIHHIELYVSNLQESLRFWDWFLLELGYVSFQKWDDGQSYKIDDTYIVFVQTKEKYLHIPYHRSGIGLNHLAFHAESRNQVDFFAEKVKEKGLTMLYQDSYPYAGGGIIMPYFLRIQIELK